MLRVGTDGDSERSFRDDDHRTRSLESTNLLDVYHAGSETETASEGLPPRAHCHFVELMPVNVERPVFFYENALAIDLAIKHLNEGYGGLVPALSGLNETCPISFSVSHTDTKYSAREAFQAVDALTEPHIGDDQRPCAFIGGPMSSVAKVTAMVTGLRGIPQVSQAATAQILNNKDDYPLFARTVPDDGFMAETLVRFYYETLGVRHLFVIAEDEAFPKSVLKSLRDAVLRLGWSPGISSNNNIDGGGMPPNSKTEAFYLEERLFTVDEEDPDDRNTQGLLYEALEAIKASDFRFVLILTNRSDNTERVVQIAHEEGIAGYGTHHLWFYEGLDLYNRRYEPDEGLAKAFDGVAYIYQTSSKEGDVYKQFLEDSKQLQAESYSTEADWLFGTYKNVTGPMLSEGEWITGGYNWGKSLYAYDATVLLGLTACQEVASSESLVLSGTDWFERIRRTNFSGVTGNMLLDPESGTRNGHSVEFAIDNWRAFKDYGDGEDNENENENEDGNYTVGFESTTTYIYKPGGHNDWDNVDLHLFSGGLNVTSLGPYPDLPPIDMVYAHVEPWIPRMGIGMLVVVLMTTAWFAIWTCRHWKTRVVQASQPHFLLLTCLGTAIMALAIFPTSMEHAEGRVTEDTRLDRACTSTWWFAFIGFGITFSTLFAKTYRINKILANSLRCKRIQLSMRETMYPVMIMFCFNVTMLSLMTALGPIGFEITDTDFDKFGRTTEKYGSCHYESALPFLIPICIVNFGIVGLALFQAWRARNLSTEFAESKYIANALLIIILLAIFAIPVLFLIQNDPNTATFIHIALLCVFTLNPLCFIFVPKITFHSRMKRPTDRLSTIMSRISSTHFSATHRSNRSFSNRGSIANRFARNSTTAPQAPETAAERLESADTPRTSTTSSDPGGEEILTTKDQRELLSEIKILEAEKAAIRKENRKLTRRLRELDPELSSNISTAGSNNDDNDNDDVQPATGDANSEMMLSNTSYEFPSANPSHNDKDPEPRSKSAKEQAIDVSSLTAEEPNDDHLEQAPPHASVSRDDSKKEQKKKQFLQFSLGGDPH